jgi:hypothetical protein
MIVVFVLYDEVIKMEKMKKHFLKIFIVSSIVLMSFVPIHASGEEDHHPNHSIIVEKGDTLYNLSNTHNTTVAKLKELNKLSTSTIKIGQELVISDGQLPFYKVIAGSFQDELNAKKRLAFIKENGMDAIITVKKLEDKTFYRVQVGAFHEKENAKQQQERLEQAGISSSFITTDE